MFKNYFRHTEKKNTSTRYPKNSTGKGKKLMSVHLLIVCISKEQNIFYWPMHILLALHILLAWHILLPLHILSPCNQVTQSKTCVSLPTLPRKMYGYVALLRLPTFSCQSTNPGLNLLPSYIIFIN